MSTEISFDANQYKYKSRVILGIPEVPKMTRFLMGKGIVKNEQQAMKFMLTVCILFVFLTIFILVQNFSKPDYENYPPLRNYPFSTN